MKVTFVTHYFGESFGYGIARYSYNLVQELKGNDIDVEVVTAIPKFQSGVKSAFDFFIYMPLKVALSKPKSEIYHFAMQQIGFSVLLFKKLHKKKVVTTIHDIHPLLISKGKLSTSFLMKATKLAVKHSDAILVGSSITKKDLLENFEIDSEKITITPYGVDDRFTQMDKSKNDVFTIGYVGSFAKSKDVPYLLRAYSIFEKNSKIPCRLLLYGKGAEYQSCVDLAKKLGIKTVEFCGFAPDSELARIYNSFDVFVFPSSAEGGGLPILEAQKCGVPVIVKADAHIPEEVTKYCLKAKDEADMAKLMEDVQREGFTFKAEHKEHLKQFSWAKCAEKTIEVYKKVLDEK